MNNPKDKFISAERADAKIRFHRAADGKSNRLAFILGAVYLPAGRLPDIPVAAPDLSAYTGRFRSDELDSILEIRMGEKGLKAKFPRREDLALVPMAVDKLAGRESRPNSTSIGAGAGRSTNSDSHSWMPGRSSSGKSKTRPFRLRIVSENPESKSGDSINRDAWIGPPKCGPGAYARLSGTSGPTKRLGRGPSRFRSVHAVRPGLFQRPRRRLWLGLRRKAFLTP